MEIPQISSFQFLDETAFNDAVLTLFDNNTLMGSVLFSPGLVNPAGMEVSTNGLQVTVTLPSPIAALFSNGVLALAHGTVSNADTDSYQVDFTSLVPATGSVTAYVTASLTTIDQNPFTITGPPVGHPDYDPTFSPFQAQATAQYSLALAATTTAPDNQTVMELGRFTLSAGQTTLPAIDTSYQVQAGINALASLALKNGAFETLTVSDTAAIGSSSPVPATITTEGNASLTAQQTVTPASVSTNSVIAGTYMNVSCPNGADQFGSYYDLGSAQVNGKGGAIKISHYGLGDGVYLDLQNKGFGMEAASFYNGSTGFLASFQASSLTNSIGFEALWNFSTVPAYGLFYASQSAGKAFVVQQNYTGNNGYPQIALMSQNLANIIYGVNNDGTVQANTPATSLAGSTSGTVNWVMPQQGTDKKLVVTFSGYENDTTTDQTITFPVAFTTQAAVTANTTGLSISVSLTTLTITAPDNTTAYNGVVIVEGI